MQNLITSTRYELINFHTALISILFTNFEICCIKGVDKNCHILLQGYLKFFASNSCETLHSKIGPPFGKYLISLSFDNSILSQKIPIANDPAFFTNTGIN